MILHPIQSHPWRLTLDAIGKPAPFTPFLSVSSTPALSSHMDLCRHTTWHSVLQYLWMVGLLFTAVSSPSPWQAVEPRNDFLNEWVIGKFTVTLEENKKKRRTLHLAWETDVISWWLFSASVPSTGWTWKGIWMLELMGRPSPSSRPTPFCFLFQCFPSSKMTSLLWWTNSSITNAHTIDWPESNPVPPTPHPNPGENCFLRQCFPNLSHLPQTVPILDIS